MTVNPLTLSACSSAEVASAVPPCAATAWSRAEVRSWAELGPVVDALAAALTAAGYPAEDILAVRLAVEQAAINCLEHGHKDEHSKAVRLAWRFAGRGLLARVEDDGAGFDIWLGRPGEQRDGWRRPAVRPEGRA
jgi:anti-sigma regulatory factor (Ser/Thr protein kinase)